MNIVRQWVRLENLERQDDYVWCWMILENGQVLVFTNSGNVTYVEGRGDSLKALEENEFPCWERVT